MEYNSQLAWLRSQLDATEQLLAQTGDNLLMRTSLENRIADLREQIASVPEQTGAARLDVWFSGRAVYGSQGIEQGFMESTSKALVGMINASTRDKVRRLKEQRKTASMPRGRFYVTALTHGSFGYELTYKDSDGMLFDDPAIVESIQSTMKVIEETTVKGLDVDALIQEQPIRMLANLKDFFSVLKKQGSTLRVESGSSALSLDSRSVDTGFDNICLSDILEKEETITATFQGAFIESGKFEYTDVEGRLLHGNISEDLTSEAIADLNRRYSGVECQLQVIKRIISYTNGRRKENVELTGITDMEPET